MYGEMLMSNQRFTLALVVSATLAVISGCVSHPKASEDAQVSEVLSQINASTAVAVNAQREMALTEGASAVHEAAQRQRLLSDKVSYDFYGDVEDLLRQLALRYHYQFDVYGKRPPERVNVNIYMVKKPAVELLKQIGYQSTAWLDVKLTSTEIELHYKPVPVSR